MYQAIKALPARQLTAHRPTTTTTTFGPITRARAKAQKETIEHIANLVRPKEKEETERKEEAACWFKVFRFVFNLNHFSLGFQNQFQLVLGLQNQFQLGFELNQTNYGLFRVD